LTVELISTARVWSAIEKVAALLLAKGTISGARTLAPLLPM
jgi:hypothetical protein